jgi:hypothetical protein
MYNQWRTIHILHILWCRPLFALPWVITLINGGFGVNWGLNYTSICCLNRGRNVFCSKRCFPNGVWMRHKLLHIQTILLNSLGLNESVTAWIERSGWIYHRIMNVMRVFNNQIISSAQPLQWLMDQLVNINFPESTLACEVGAFHGFMSDSLI